MTFLEKLMLLAFVVTAVQFVWINVVPQPNRHRRS